jgi:two-component system chemotaxis sensor kinase CheA
MADDLRRAFIAEARELCEQLTLAALQVDREGTLSPEQRRHLLRVAHTLKGAARVVGEKGIADAAHAIEDLVAANLDAVADDLAPRLLRQIDSISAALPANSAVLDAIPASDMPAVTAGNEPIRTVRIELAAIDAALERVAGLSRRCTLLRQDVEADARTEDATGRVSQLDQLAVEVALLRSQLHELRLAPARTLFASLERAIRDASAAGRVRTRFEATGGEHRLDADLLDSVRDALIQLVRNAVAHGVEPPDVRAAKSKPHEGLVAVAVERRGPDVAFIVSDDGRGLDVTELRAAAVRAGIGSAVAADEEGLIALLLEGGLSTQATVSQISGRGVGLDVVRTMTSRFGGRVTLVNRPGRGVTVTLLLPVTLRSLRYVRMESRDVAALVPLDAVRRVSRVADLQQLIADERPHLVVDSAPVAQLSLRSVLARDGDDPADNRVAAIVVAGGTTVALTATRLGEVDVTIAQSLPRLAGASPVIRAIALSDFGEIIPVLEPQAFAAALISRTAMVASVARARRLLVVDDSITTRMLEQSILEGAGYAVDTVASAEEALDRAASTRYDLFIVDVEMPGMNGFDFVAATRAHQSLSDTPAILVTSRGAPEDRQRGVEAGARAYIVKSEFDQEVFLNTVRGLIG